jgi:hypothetical protein
MLAKVMADEVSALCGPAYRPDHIATCYRSGSATGYAYMESRREEVNRPRVRQRTDDGASEEVILNSYSAAQDPSEVQRLLLAAMLAAGSTRKVGTWSKPSAAVVDRSCHDCGVWWAGRSLLSCDTVRWK